MLNGVSHGAILSPVLFCDYFDTLLSNLNAAGIGCHIGSFYGALAYADDLVLLAPSANALRCMLNTVHISLKSCLVPANLSVFFVATSMAQYATQSACSQSFLIGSQPIEFVDK